MPPGWFSGGPGGYLRRTGEMVSTSFAGANRSRFEGLRVSALSAPSASAHRPVAAGSTTGRSPVVAGQL
ncbi:conserved domain protein [Actinomyces sp. oral taxon 170 str. F0386]|nr:conserved domain protein [Actinomyces sp. oral taxon 170 str. F0386]